LRRFLKKKSSNKTGHFHTNGICRVGRFEQNAPSSRDGAKNGLAYNLLS
jgi:hypothetical protein